MLHGVREGIGIGRWNRGNIGFLHENIGFLDSESEVR